MTIEIRVPELPESVADATVGNWHKSPGESVKAGESLVDIETDKVVLEVPAPSDGVLTRILVERGNRVLARQLLAELQAGRGDGRRRQGCRHPDPVGATPAGGAGVEPSQLVGTGKEVASRARIFNAIWIRRPSLPPNRWPRAPLPSPRRLPRRIRLFRSGVRRSGSP